MTTALPATSFAAQLEYLERIVLPDTLTPEGRLVVLSIAQSVKAARDHDLNCRPDPHGDVKRVPQAVYDALLAWSGAEPSQSVLALAVDGWRRVPHGIDGAPRDEEAKP